jgi:DNA-binding Lrp family transcriptional regulator
MDDYHRFVTEDFSKIKNVSRFYSSFVMETSKYETAFEFEVD